MWKKTNAIYSNQESWCEVLWEALDEFREQVIPEENSDANNATQSMEMETPNDEIWDDITTVMAWIRESLEMPDEVTLQSNIGMGSEIDSHLDSDSILERD